jgi:hypothetical protein
VEIVPYENITPCPPILAAGIALVVVHGFGRFVYTPLIPLLVSDGLITLPQAAQIASWNYVAILAAQCWPWANTTGTMERMVPETLLESLWGSDWPGPFTHQGPRLSATFITLYGLAQLVGPRLAKSGIEQGAHKKNDIYKDRRWPAKPSIPK